MDSLVKKPVAQEEPCALIAPIGNSLTLIEKLLQSHLLHLPLLFWILFLVFDSKKGIPANHSGGSRG